MIRPERLRLAHGESDGAGQRVRDDDRRHHQLRRFDPCDRQDPWLAAACAHRRQRAGRAGLRARTIKLAWVAHGCAHPGSALECRGLLRAGGRRTWRWQRLGGSTGSVADCCSSAGAAAATATLGPLLITERTIAQTRTALRQLAGAAATPRRRTRLIFKPFTAATGIQIRVPSRRSPTARSRRRCKPAATSST